MRRHSHVPPRAHTTAVCRTGPPTLSPEGCEFASATTPGGPLPETFPAIWSAAHPEPLQQPFQRRDRQERAPAPADACDVWPWTAICADTRQSTARRVRNLAGETAIDVMVDLRYGRINRAQLTGKGHQTYLETGDDAFGGDLAHAIPVGRYGGPQDAEDTGRRYPAADNTATSKRRVECSPHPARVLCLETQTDPLPGGSPISTESGDVLVSRSLTHAARPSRGRASVAWTLAQRRNRK